VYEYNIVYDNTQLLLHHTPWAEQGDKMDQGRIEKIKAWVDHGIKSGRAIVYPAGTHKLPEPLQGFDDRLNACRCIGELEGFANRRQFDPTLPRWTEEQRAAIITRKVGMLNVVKRKRK